MSRSIPSFRLMITCVAFALALGTCPLNAASFDCDAEALKADEQVICDIRALNDLDVKMATTFELLTGLMPMGSRDHLKEEQAAWLAKRQACNADAQCLRLSYDERMKQLETVYGGIERPL